jgi:hypothetical protein
VKVHVVVLLLTIFTPVTLEPDTVPVVPPLTTHVIDTGPNPAGTVWVTERALVAPNGSETEPAPVIAVVVEPLVEAGDIANEKTADVADGVWVTMTNVPFGGAAWADNAGVASTPMVHNATDIAMREMRLIIVMTLLGNAGSGAGDKTDDAHRRAAKLFDETPLREERRAPPVPPNRFLTRR